MNKMSKTGNLTFFYFIACCIKFISFNLYFVLYDRILAFRPGYFGATDDIVDCTDIQTLCTSGPTKKQNW